MSQFELPSRAKPEALQEISKHVRKNGPKKSRQLYDEMDIDRRQIRASIDYGVKLGFLDVKDDVVSVSENGHTISYGDSLDEKIVSEVFRDAIRGYEPYRGALTVAHSNGLKKEIKGGYCITQSAFQQAIKLVTGEEFSARTINLLIKTAEAADLGQFITGRKGLETRLDTTEDFEPFAEQLINDYGLPEQSEEESDEGENTETVTGAGDDTEPTKTPPANTSGTLRITAEWDVSDKSGEAIAELIAELRNMEVDKIA